MYFKAKLVPVLIMLSVMAPGATAADEVYRWVDENGVVHFADKTAATPEAERVEVRPQGDNGLGTTPLDEPEQDADFYNAAASRAQQRRDERVAQRKAAAEKQQQLASGCDQARQRVTRLEPSPRVLVENEDGSVERMDDNRRLELLAEAKAYIAENCEK